MNHKIGILVVLALGVVFAAGIGACAVSAQRGAGPLGRRWSLGWSLVAGALLCRFLGDATWLWLGFGSRAAPSTAGAAAGYLLALQPVLLCAGLSFLAVQTGRRIAARRVMMGLDALIFTGSAVALLWWFWLEPLLMLSGAATLARLGWIRPFDAGLNTLAVVLTALTVRSSVKKSASDKAIAGKAGAKDARNARDVSANIKAAAGSFLLFFGVTSLAFADLRFFMSLPARHISPADWMFLFVAPLFIGGAALWKTREAFSAREQAIRDHPPARIAPELFPSPSSAPSSSSVPSRPTASEGRSANGLAAVSSDAISAAAPPPSFMSTHASATGISRTTAETAALVGDAAPLNGVHAMSSVAANPDGDVENATPSAVKESALSSLLEKTSALDTNPLESMFLLFLPCLVALIGVWHLSGSFVMPTVHGRLGLDALGEMWWGPTLVLFAALRHGLAALQSTYQARGVREQAGLLKDQVSLRTHQLSTLHAVAADLNNTLNREQVLSTALERMMEAVHADAGAVWLRVDFIALVGGEGASRDLGGGQKAKQNDATQLRREYERHANGEPAEGDQTAVGSQGRWRQVRSSGTQTPEQQRAIELMDEALERGGLTRCAQVCSTQPEVFGSAHVAPIRWKGEVMGTLGVMRTRGELEPAERALLESIALEVGAALQNAHLYQEATRRANLDGVTDLYNHRTIQEKLGQELSNAKLSGKPLTIVMMDLNNFKFFNDTYGHPVGDTVLRTVARCLRDICRTDDIMGRYGGDEFVAILPDTDAHGAYEVCSRIAARVEGETFQENDGRKIPIGLSFGAAVYPHDGNAALELLTIADANLYEAKRGGAPVLIQRPGAEETQELRQLKDVGVGGSFGVLDALVTAIDNKDHYTRRHSEDVTHWATLMARELEYSTETQRAIRICGLLHDVGKIAVPDAVLRKPGRLSDDEFNIMQQHPVFGALIVKDVPNLTEVLGGIRHHHERFDGKGYPDKLLGEDIPMMGRLLAVPDCFSAMTTDRPYRKALTWTEALNEIERGRGTQFDPVMADAFLEVMARIVVENQERALGKTNPHPAPVDADASETLREQAASVFGTQDEAQSDAPDGEDIVRPRSVTDAEPTAVAS